MIVLIQFEKNHVQFLDFRSRFHERGYGKEQKVEIFKHDHPLSKFKPDQYSIRALDMKEDELSLFMSLINFGFQKTRSVS